MKAIRLDVDLFGKANHQWSERALRHMLFALFQINKDYLKYYPKAPKLYKSGIIYCREQGTENWQPIPQCLKLGRGDCEDLACYRAAELSINGIDAMPLLKKSRKQAGLLYHVVVRYSDGRIEDPSAILGMGDPRIEGICEGAR